MSLHRREMNAAEVSLAAIEEVDKLHFVMHVKDLPTLESRNAEMAVFRRRFEEAEQILLQAGLHGLPPCNATQPPRQQRAQAEIDAVHSALIDQHLRPEVSHLQHEGKSAETSYPKANEGCRQLR